MSSTKAIKITYSLNPPSSVVSGKTPESLPPKSKTHQFPVVFSVTTDPDQSSQAASSEKDTKSYYSELRKAIETARLEVGDELTRWRDIVGKEELGKEGRKGKTVADVDEDEGEQEEEEV